MAERFSAEECAAIEAYVREIADLLGLRDWLITVSNEPPSDPATLAEVQCVNGRKRARMKFTLDFRTLELPVQREVVVHELIHIHWEGAWAVLRHDLADYLGQLLYDHTMSSFRRQAELGIDGIAHSVSRYIPLPSWSGQQRTESDMMHLVDLKDGDVQS